MTAPDVTIQPAPSNPLDTRRRDWLAERRTHLTGTDAGKILSGRGLQVWLDKRNLSGDEGPSAGYMRRGLYLERGVLQWYADTHGCAIEFAQPYTFHTVEHAPLFGCTLDARREAERWPVDAKTITMREQYDATEGTGWGEDDSDQMPLIYAAQLAIQMAATRTTRADLAVVFGFSGLVTFTLHRDAEMEGDLFERLTAWWQRHIVEGVMPTPDGSAAFTDYLKKRVQQASDVIRDATEDEEAAALRFMALKAEEKRIKAEEKRIKEGLDADGNVLRAAIGENAGLRSSLMQATWKAAKAPISTNWEQVARRVAFLSKMPVGDFTTLVDEETEAGTSSRRLLVTTVKPSKGTR